jgi:hypothetical protein
MSVARFAEIKRGPSENRSKRVSEAQENHVLEYTPVEEAIAVLFCFIDAYRNLNPKGHHYQALKWLSDSEIITLALFQQLRGMESERSFIARGRPLLLSFEGCASSWLLGAFGAGGGT